MQRAHVGLIALAILCSAAVALAEGAVKEADRTCYTATAVLLTGDGSEAGSAWQRIRDVIATNKRWTIVSEPPQNRVGEMALVRFDIKNTYRGGPTVAYTVQCGHGGTCNDVAVRFHEKHPQIVPAPIVQCGDVSNVLVNPQVER